MITILALALTSLTLFVAAFAKLRTSTSTEESLRTFGLSPIAAHYGRRLLPSVEIAVAVLLVLPWTYRLGAVAAFVLLGIFSLVILNQLARGRNPRCSCFGSSSTTPVSYRTLARNALLSAPSVAVALGLTRGLDELVVAHPAVTISIAFGAVSLALSAIIALLWQQQAGLISRVNKLESPAGHNVPTEAPASTNTVDLRAPFRSLAGTTMSLADRLADVRYGILVFVHAECAPCRELLTDFSRLDDLERDDLRVLFGLSGPVEPARELFSFVSAENVIRIEPGIAAKSFGVSSTPAAVMITPSGDIIQQARGRTRVLDMLQGMQLLPVRQAYGAYSPTVGARANPVSSSG